VDELRRQAGGTPVIVVRNRRDAERLIEQAGAAPRPFAD